MTVIGFIQGTSVLGLITINAADDILHPAVASASLAVFVTTAEQRVSTARA